MNTLYDTNRITSQLLNSLLKGKGVVAIKYVKNAEFSETQYFKSLSEIEPIIHETLADTEVTGCWIGCHQMLSDDLKIILDNISNSRSLNRMVSMLSCWTVWNVLD